jgi:pimeloyl-ACP methyl ester carboxylesterase
VPAPATIGLSAPAGPRLAGSLWDAPPGSPGVLIVPGLGSERGSHADIARALQAAGIACLALDLRGHGDSDGELDAGTPDDVTAGLTALAERGHAPLGIRGSSMGGLLALHAAARDERVRAVVAICAARPDGLARLAQDRWPLEIDPAALRADGVARGYWHATGDDQVPWGSTFALAGAAPYPKRLRIALGGGHGTLQHDPTVLAETVAFLAEHLARS